MFDKNKAFSLLADDIKCAVKYINKHLSIDAASTGADHCLPQATAAEYDDVLIRMTMPQLEVWVGNVLHVANDVIPDNNSALKFLGIITAHWGKQHANDTMHMLYNIACWSGDRSLGTKPVTYSKQTDWAVRVDCGKPETFELGMNVWKWLCAQSYYSAAETHTMRDLVECTSTANDKNEFATNIKALGFHPREYSSEFNKIMSLLPAVVGCEKILNMTIAEFADVWAAVDGKGNKRFI